MISEFRFRRIDLFLGMYTQRDQKNEMRCPVFAKVYQQRENVLILFLRVCTWGHDYICKSGDGWTSRQESRWYMYADGWIPERDRFRIASRLLQPKV